MSALDRSIDAFLSNFPTTEEAFMGQIRAELHSIGETALTKHARELGQGILIFGASGSSDYALAAQGRAVAPVVRGRSDLMAAAILTYLYGDAAQIEPSSIDMILWSARWCEWGFPVVTLTSEQFAALAWTDIREEDLAEVKPPWPAFSIRLQPGAFPVVLSENLPEVARAYGVGETGLHVARRIAVTAFQGTNVEHRIADMRARTEPYWTIRLDVSKRMHLWSARRTLAELKAEAAPVLGDALDEVAPDELENRALRLANQVALNTMISMAAHGITHAKRKKGAYRGRFSPTSKQEYVLGAPVTIDVMPAVRAYLTGFTDKTFKVRWTVRGHWRNQVCGASRTERRKVWIAPHWKGHREAPINVREHVFGDET